MSVQVFQSAAFARAYKKLHTQQQTDADQAVAAIVADPALGEPKKGDLSGVFVYKYRSQQQLMHYYGSLSFPSIASFSRMPCVDAVYSGLS